MTPEQKLALARECAFEEWKARQVKYRGLEEPYPDEEALWFSTVERMFNRGAYDLECGVQSALIAIERTRIATLNSVY